MEADVDGLIGAGRHERSGDRTTWRNGYRDRSLDTRLGTLNLKIPKLRTGAYFPGFLEPRKTVEKALVSVIQEAWIAGVSTRRVDELVHAMGMGDIDPEGLHIASTERMIQLVAERPASQFIIATETGIMHRMEKLAPEKEFLPADPEAVCAYMKTITLPRVKESLELDRYHITVPEDVAQRARGAVDRMVALGAGGKPGD